MPSTDLVFFEAAAPYPGGVDLVFGTDAVTALRALVLRLGVLEQSRVGEEGMYPALRISTSGGLVAGGAGINLVIDSGRIRQVLAGEVSAA